MINTAPNALSLKDISCLLFTLNQSVGNHARQHEPLQLDKIQYYTKADRFYILINDLRQSNANQNACYQTFYFPTEQHNAFNNTAWNTQTQFAINQVCQRRFFHDNDLVEQHPIENSSYHAFALKSEHARQSSWVLINHNRYDSFYVFERLPEQPAFTTRDHQLIALLLPHISLYLHSFQGNTPEVSLVDLYQRILDSSDKGLAVCNQHGQPIVLNQPLSQHLKNSQQLMLQNNNLTLSESLTNKQFQHYIQQSCHPDATELLSLAWFDEQQEVGITVNPLNMTYPHQGHVCLVVFDYQQQLNWAVIAKEYELTEKERVLVKAIYQQQSLQQIAEYQQVSYNTVRSHLQHIFKKMAVHGQAQLMAKLSLFKGL